MLSNSRPKNSDKEISRRYRGGQPKQYPTRVSKGTQQNRHTAMSVAQQNMQRLMGVPANRSGQPTTETKLESPQKGFPGPGNKQPGDL